MTREQIEALVLKLVERYLRAWRCSHCGGRWLTGRSQVALFHACVPASGRTRAPHIDVGVRTLEEHRSELWHGFARSLPGEALLRPVE